MSLDVSPPPVPTLDNETDDEYRRGDLEIYLHDGAWEDAFNRWAGETDMDARTFGVATDLELFQRFDFFWDEIAQRVGYSAPGIPDDWQQHEYHEELTSWEDVSTINAELAEFGQTVCDVLKVEYIDWEDDEYGDDLDLPEY